MDDARGWPLRVPAAAACIVALFFALPDTKAPRRVFNITQPESREALKTLERWPGQHPWIVTDSPIDAYYAARLVPPSLAVYSKKRVASGHLPPAQIISEIQTFKPDQVMFRRPNIRPYPEVLSYLRRHYRQVPDQRWFHFIAKDGLAAASAGHATATEDAALRDLATRVTRAFAGLSIHGGYSGFYDLEQDRLFERASDSAKTLPPDTITIRPPGSTALVGGCLLRIAQILDDYVALQHATNAARALACVQHPQGGWTATAGVSSECQPFTDVTEKNPLTLDEGTPGVVLDFLLDLRLDFETRGREAPDWLEHGIRRGFDFLLRTQLENGGWPRQDLKANPFSSLATLNDGVTSSAIAILLRGFETYRDDKLLQAARRGGQFLIKAQGRPPLAGWSQQYTSDLRPAAARSFEPAALASRESAQAMLALVDLYLATREPLFLEPLPRAAAWLAQSRTAPERWAAFMRWTPTAPSTWTGTDRSMHRCRSYRRSDAWDMNGRRPFPRCRRCCACSRRSAPEGRTACPRRCRPSRAGSRNWPSPRPDRMSGTCSDRT
jgi:PelA/Pel-15E family pectate lyase